MVRVGDDTAETGSFLCRPGTGYRTRTGKTCCPASNIRQDNLHSWFRADARLSSMSGGVASISLRLYFRYVFNERVEWRPLRWELLSEMHGRRVHVSAASTDLRYAWHVHPDAASLAPNAADLPIQLRLPDGAGSTPLTVRLHASFGVRAWDPAIQMCIDSEDVVHVDPGRGQEMLVEGEALTNPVTLTPAGHSRPRPEPPLVAALSADRRLADIATGHRLAGALFGEARSQVPAEAAAHAQRPLIAPACVGLNLYVRSADGYLAMGAHAIIARRGGEAMPSLAQQIARCDAALPGMRGEWEMAPPTPFGPSLAGARTGRPAACEQRAWIADAPGTFAVFVMAKVRQDDGSQRGSFALLAPTFYVQGPLLWSDEFDGSSIDESKWMHDNSPPENGEEQDYVGPGRGTSRVADGSLALTARRSADGTVTSARLTTLWRFNFTYGIVEARVRAPLVAGLWPAFWMLGTDLLDPNMGWPACGEIDVMEIFGTRRGAASCSTVHNSRHSWGTLDPLEGGCFALEEPEPAWHVWRLLWTPRRIAFFIDDGRTPIYSYSPAQRTAANFPYTRPQYLIANLAVGGDGPSQPVDFSALDPPGTTLFLDYVRVYALPDGLDELAEMSWPNDVERPTLMRGYARAVDSDAAHEAARVAEPEECVYDL
ncbi:hypothetical protein EMIHUDRAFT_203217 [Emiliania huxleyi CCMP1516]|uniref:GH16 domain-containing protein n=2 Tax=Emiliania huxleyi TaxID=2903 RepID=A0A0D3K5S1_EMIH1|nr:hypothetical protein EMIHUDRAFT_203217 [Emiliania huxleyi CCMP1516]EOD31106.1 hypothetical protein EMIHUDRAFT_203217 [Emiliania huxleyi CCMP1516]|eukprot:XP_005783535.1 hypothetical protein EMIHUDRAFT_203217 [Emiliania huxleyi CCMP1516]